MTIIICKKGFKTTVLNSTRFEKEHNLQEYIHEHPESIPVYDIREDKRLFVAPREFPTESGSIDALAVDKDGDIYIVETKLYRNPDKRTVVAQALDYGASLWKHYGDFTEVLRILDQASREKWQVLFLEKARQFFSFDEEEGEVLLSAMKNNLHEGNLKFVILMDSVDERLKVLITYVNQNSQFDIYAVQLEYYRHDEYEILIPKLYGAEVKKDFASPASSGKRRKWDEAKMLEDARKGMDAKEVALFQRIYQYAKENADQINFGTGSYATFSPIFRKLCNKSLFTVGTDKRLSFNFEWIGKDNEQARDLFKKALDEIGFHLPEDYRSGRPSVLIDEWGPKIDAFLDALTRLLA